jgi:hypothetical protein
MIMSPRGPTPTGLQLDGALGTYQPKVHDMPQRLDNFGAVLPPPKAQTRLWSSLALALAKSTRWSWLTVAWHVVGQLGLLAVTGKWPLQPSAANTMRGVDFYPRKDFLHALIRGAYMFRSENGFLPSLTSPTSFNERIFARKYFAPLLMPSLADKLAAKNYVRARLGDEFVPAVAWVGDDIGELVAAKPPAGRYVLKANHGQSWNLFLNLPEDFSAKRYEIEQRALSWLTSRFGYEWGEWQYSTFKPMLFLEEFVDFNGVQAADDYKFYCFDGKVCLIQVDVDRFTHPLSAFYSPDWRHFPVTFGEEQIQRPRPRNLEDMIRVAEAIAGEMDFARIDLYTDGNSRIKFGEITNTPGNAINHWSDFEFDLWLGRQFGK